MKQYIFITTEGYTFSPNSENYEPDVENCQVIGFESGINPNEAFNRLRINCANLKDIGFSEIICYEIGNEGKSESFSLN